MGARNAHQQRNVVPFPKNRERVERFAKKMADALGEAFGDKDRKRTEEMYRKQVKDL